jgi:hypothetical protein
MFAASWCFKKCRRWARASPGSVPPCCHCDRRRSPPLVAAAASAAAPAADNDDDVDDRDGTPLPSLPSSRKHKNQAWASEQDLNLTRESGTLSYCFGANI